MSTEFYVTGFYYREHIKRQKNKILYKLKESILLHKNFRLLVLPVLCFKRSEMCFEVFWNHRRNLLGTREGGNFPPQYFLETLELPYLFCDHLFHSLI